MRELPPIGGCFVCGLDNPSGLHIRFYSDGKGAYGEYVPSRDFQGYEGVLHGGIITSLLDEVMAKALVVQGTIAMTGKLEVRFRRPVSMGQRLLLKGWVTSQRRRGFITAAEIINPQGEILAEAQGLFFPMKAEPNI